MDLAGPASPEARLAYEALILVGVLFVTMRVVGTLRGTLGGVTTMMPGRHV
jgi:hypothetical protein